jgi:hypothetical protein
MPNPPIAKNPPNVVAFVRAAADPARIAPVMVRIRDFGDLIARMSRKSHSAEKNKAHDSIISVRLQYRYKGEHRTRVPVIRNALLERFSRRNDLLISSITPK